MARRYRKTFQFFNTEEEAQSFCNIKNQDYYIRKNHKSYYTPWSSSNGLEHKFVAWYATK